MGTDCGHHPPTPPPSASLHPEPEHASLSGEPEGGKLTPVSAVHEAALKSDQSVVDLQPVLVCDKLSELGRPWQRWSSAGQGGRNVKMHSSTFLNGYFQATVSLDQKGPPTLQLMRERGSKIKKIER